jgi:hypothetical protein
VMCLVAGDDNSRFDLSRWYVVGMKFSKHSKKQQVEARVLIGYLFLYFVRLVEVNLRDKL